MLYIVCKVVNTTGRHVIYRGFETLSHSKVSMTEESLKELIINDIVQVANASIVQDSIVITTWENGLALEVMSEIREHYVYKKHSGPKYVMVSKENERYKLVDNYGTMSDYTAGGLRDIVTSGEVANCRIEKSGGKDTLHMTDVYIINRDKAFKKLIDSKYNTYLAKTLLLGLRDSTFEYSIENHEVILTDYTGKNTDIILPPFITAIDKEAFRYPGVTTIKLNSGLKIIGEEALATAIMSKGIPYVEIPETVGLICAKAFQYSKRLHNFNGTINKEKFKLLGNKTVML